MTDNKQSIINSLITLMGPDADLSDIRINTLSMSEIRTAYIKMAYATHPDRAKITGLDVSLSTLRFKEVNRAYVCLKTFLPEYLRKNTISAPEVRQHTARRKQETASRSQSHGHLPGKYLLFGQYLYYAGAVDMRSLLEAVKWQRRQRPVFGEIALQWKILGRHQISAVLKNKKFNEKFGDCASRLGLLTEFQRRAIIAKQINSHKRIGTYFTENKIISDSELNRFIAGLNDHNLRYRH